MLNYLLLGSCAAGLLVPVFGAGFYRKTIDWDKLFFKYPAFADMMLPCIFANLLHLVLMNRWTSP